uniref:Uncharacterized protein n=1 Tax=Anopheles culicifacies TaxID=139723 RepID=A0A182MRV0_9DIPT
MEIAGAGNRKCTKTQCWKKPGFGSENAGAWQNFITTLTNVANRVPRNGFPNYETVRTGTTGGEMGKELRAAHICMFFLDNDATRRDYRGVEREKRNRVAKGGRRSFQRRKGQRAIKSVGEK